MDVQGRGRWARSGQDIQGDWAPSADDKAAPTPGNREVQTGSLSVWEELRHSLLQT